MSEEVNPQTPTTEVPTQDIDALVNDLTDNEKDMLRNSLGGMDSKQNVHTFLHGVAFAQDTTKLGNLDATELGKAENSLRTYKFLSLFADKIMLKPELREFFNTRGEILTSTSLSKEALLVKLAVTQKRELADTTPGKRNTSENKGWFKKKDAQPSENQT